jgi:hypothetical protein
MAIVKSSWLRQGYFVLGNEGLMPSVRVELEKALSLNPGSLNITNYPPATNWKHTYWWREGHTQYAEAQFFAQIAKEYPVLSLGIAIEKGFEDAEAAKTPQALMDRGVWDWPRLVGHIDALLSVDVPAAARALRSPVNLRITTKAVVGGEGRGWRTRAFSYVEEGWFERYVGAVEPATIVTHVSEIDKQKNSWAIVHFAHDLSPAESEGLSVTQVASSLLAFARMRDRLHGSIPTSANGL